MSGSLYRSPSAALYKSPSMSAFGGLPAAFGSMSVADLGSLTRLEDKIRLLQEDLESERELRNRIERERADLSVQLIALTDRLEDAEGTTDSQIESNRKREAELQKLRKLLEESQLENEDAMNILRKKHQDACLDYAEQIEQLQKKNSKIDRERQRLQHEVIELTATIDQLQKDKHLAEKAAERFEAQTVELSNKVEDLNRHVNDLAQQRQRLQAENNDLLKEIHDQKVQLDNLQHVKYQLAQQLEEARRRLEDAERERSQLQAQLHQVQLELDSVRTALDEESAARAEAEHKLALANTEITQWKSKFDAEVALHHEEVEDLRKKMLQKQAEYEEQIEIMLQKISQLEKAKSRLQSEVEVLIVDLEKAQNTIAILERAKEQLEKTVNELKVRIDELTVELEAAQREARAALAELQKMKNLYEKAVEQKEALARENKKLQDDLHEAKEALADANRKLHELDLENARLAGEIRELQTALKESEAARRDAENRAQRALAELQQLRIEMERRLQEKEEEMEALRKNMQFEIDRLTAALADAEARMKAEISRLKKKYQAEIAELEMTVDNLNRANIEAQKTIKKQSEQLKILQASLEDTQRQLQQTLDQYALAQRKVSALSAELEECKVALDNAIRARKQAEIDLEEANGRITDLVSVNNNLTAIKNKLETELSTAQADLDEATKELHAADERANRALADAARAVEQLHEEQEHSMKIDALRKSLEEQVKQLQVQIQEALKNKIKKMIISGKEVWPIIEGGKGIAVSDGGSSGAFAAADAVGTFSGANAKLIDDNGELVPLVYKGKTRNEKHEELIEYSIGAGVSQARIANEISKGRGRVHMNVLWEMGAAERVLHGILEKAKGLVHGITCGAGMPYRLGEIAAKYQVYYYPIISSVRAFKALWKRAYQRISSFLLGGVVYEDPWLAGGHNGLSNSENPELPQAPFERVVELRSFMNEIGLSETPIVMAGGVWRLKDWEHWFDNLQIGPIAFQFGTRLLLTKESPISAEWKKKLLTLEEGDVFLNKFSPTGFYSSAVRNNFIRELQERNSRQIKFSENASEEFDSEFAIGARGRNIYLTSKDKELADTWSKAGYTEAMRTPDTTVIFVTPDKFAEIRRDQINCMGCLSHCLFSNWKDHGDYSTGRKPDPRSFCIQKTLQNIIHDGNIENELMFSGHSVYRFKQDPFYENGYIPTVKELVERILTGY